MGGSDTIMDIGSADPVIFIIGLVITIVVYILYTRTHPDRPGG